MAASFPDRIDSISLRLGRVVAWLVLGNIGALVYEFVARHFFNSPTVWSYDMTYFLYGTHFLMGAAFTLQMKSHIRIEILYQRFSPRRQAFFDLVGYLVFFFPVMVTLIYAGVEFAGRSFEIHEKSGLSPWRPLLYPFKALVTLSFFFLLLQGVAEFLRSLARFRKGR